MDGARESRIESGRRLGKKYGKITGSALGIKYGPINTAKKVIDTSSGKIYPSAKDAATKNNFNYGTFKSWLIGSRKNKTQFKYI